MITCEEEKREVLEYGEAMSFIGSDELYDEYLSQPTEVLNERFKELRVQMVLASFEAPMFSSEPNIASYFSHIMEEQKWIFLLCEYELTQRGYDTE